MNTRIQVEHPVTELVYGVDLVRAQLELAEGRWPAALGDPGGFSAARSPEGWPWRPGSWPRIPAGGFLPTPGPLRVYREPRGRRHPGGFGGGPRATGSTPSSTPMIAKLIVWGPDRAAAVARLSEALEDFVILGCTTNLPLLQAISPQPRTSWPGAMSTAWIQDHLEAPERAAPAGAPAWPSWAAGRFREALSCAFRGLGRPGPGPAAPVRGPGRPGTAASGSAREQPPFRLEPGPEPHRFTLRRTRSGGGAGAGGRRSAGPRPAGPGLARALERRADPSLPFAACRLEGPAMALAVLGETLVLEDPLARLAAPGRRRAGAWTRCWPPWPARCWRCTRSPGDPVEPGQLLFVLESMKMQFEISAPRAGPGGGGAGDGRAGAPGAGTPGGAGGGLIRFPTCSPGWTGTGRRCRSGWPGPR